MWPFWSKLDLTSSNRCCADGVHDGEMSRLGIRNRGMVNDPHDSRRKDKLFTSHYPLIDIYKRENEMREKVYSKVLNEGKQKESIIFGNGVIERRGMENKCHHHI